MVQGPISLLAQFTGSSGVEHKAHEEGQGPPAMLADLFGFGGSLGCRDLRVLGLQGFRALGF